MNQCDEIRLRLSAYLDGEVGEKERERVRRHLASCESCRRELRQLEETARLLGGLEELAPPATLASGLHVRLRRQAAAALVSVGLVLLVIVPVATMAGIFLRPDLPAWARGGFALATACFGVAIGLLVLSLVRHVRNLLVFGYLSGAKE